MYSPVSSYCKFFTTDVVCPASGITLLNRMYDLHPQNCFSKDVIFCSLTREVVRNFNPRSIYHIGQVVHVIMLYFVFQTCAVNLFFACGDSIVIFISSWISR